MHRRTSVVAAALLICLTTACLSPVPREDWPVKDDPLFRSTVWIEPPDAYGSGVIVHSSGRGTYVLTAAHVATDDDGYRFPDGVVEVGVFALSHASRIREPYVMYTADIVATTSPSVPADGDPTEGILTRIGWVAGVDLVILRLRTDRRFVAAPIFAGSPDAVSYKPAVLVPIVPEMYPHRKHAICSSGTVACPDSVKGNSGAPVFVDGEVVGLSNWGGMGPGPRQLQEFIRKHDGIRFLLEEPDTPGGGTETPDSDSQREH